MLKKTFPFLGWFKGYRIESLRIDFISGLTVALVLIPQCMAYAKLAGLPAFVDLVRSIAPNGLITMLALDHNTGHTGYVQVVIK